MRLSSPTVSSQIRQLEAQLGQKLFTRRGRNLVLTDAGSLVASYADRIFPLGQELLDAVRDRAVVPSRLVVGVSDVLARSIVHRILEPVFRPELNLRVICKESRSTEDFHEALAARTMDVVLSDAPAGRKSALRTFSHPLGDCGTAWFAAPALARRLRRNFPRSLDRAPLVLPSDDSTFRRALDEWFVQQAIRPRVIAELDDVALVGVLGEQALGVFAAPDVIADEICRRYRVHAVGRTPSIRQRFFAISIERTIKHPGVSAICEAARASLFT